MPRLLHHLRIALHYCAQALKMNMEYRLDFLVECLAALAMQYTSLLTLQLMFRQFHSMQDATRHWNDYEVFFIFGFSLIPMGLFSASAMSFYQFSDKYLVGGEMDRLLMRPLSSLFQLLLEGIAFDFLPDLGLGIAVMIYAWPHLGTAWTPLVCLQMMWSIIGAWGVLTGIFLALISLSFWSQDRLSILPPVYNLLNFAKFPITIYKPIVRVLLTWIIPFGFAAFYPASGFLQNTEAFRYFSMLAPAAGALCMLIGITTWRQGIRQYSGAGT
ncbi:MAG TPA: ABC-2 family transporter protein [Planctomycetota bacterium]|nr:ABC-2 family transporter protein [Planctomycetota bacterium]